jgi:hypothetical protein
MLDEQALASAKNDNIRLFTVPRQGSPSGDFGWLLLRTDGHIARWLCDPYTLKFRKNFARHAMRWFAG